MVAREREGWKGMVDAEAGGAGGLAWEVERASSKAAEGSKREEAFAIWGEKVALRERGGEWMGEKNPECEGGREASTPSRTTWGEEEAMGGGGERNVSGDMKRGRDGCGKRKKQVWEKDITEGWGEGVALRG